MRALFVVAALSLVSGDGFAGTIFLQPGPSEGKDSHLALGGPGTEFRANNNFGSLATMSFGGGQRSVIEFMGIPALLPGQSIISARLGLTIISGADTSAPIEIYRLLHHWVEGSKSDGTIPVVPDGVTWQTVDGSTDWPGISGFRTPDGAGYSLASAEINDPIGSGIVTLTSAPSVSWVNLNPSKIEEWMTGSLPNNGLLIRSLNEHIVPANVNAATSDHPTSTFRPILEIQLSPEVPEPTSLVLFGLGVVWVVVKRKMIASTRY